MPVSPSLAPPSRRPAAGPGSVILGRRTLLAIAGITTGALVWAGGVTWYIAFKDEFAQSFLARQTELRYVYEDQIAQLKGRLEREITSNLVERNGFAARADAIATRQSEIEARQTWLSVLAERLGGGAATAREPAARPAALPAGITAPPAVKPSPIPAESLDLPFRRSGDDALRDVRPAERLSGVETSLRLASDATTGLAETVRRAARERALRLRVALEGTRLDPARLAARSAPMGGPFVPLPAAFDSGAFAPLVADAEAGFAEFATLAAAARMIPLGRPLAGELEPTSPFGYRVDPFNRSAALHTGVDLRAEPGTAVRATAPGRVVTAEPTGGYGNMVEVEHEGGVATRYAHLAAITVMPGQRVEAGQTVGRAGSTGRSTGSHLHYETRVNGEPVNPMRFLEAGRLLADIR